MGSEATHKPDNEFTARVEAFVADVRSQLLPCLESEEERFPSASGLVSRFNERAARLLERGPSELSGYREAHNELVVAAELLSERNALTLAALEYEPPIPGANKRFDFHVSHSDAKESWLEVKTIYPEDQDDWAKFVALRDRGRFPDTVQVLLQEELLGGESFHDSYAARAHLLDYALEVEEKIRACGIDWQQAPCHLVVCTSAYKLPLHEIEAFVSFYRSGAHAPWDEFGPMEEHSMRLKRQKLLGTITRFAYFDRPTTEIWPKNFNWNVQPPSLPF